MEELSLVQVRETDTPFLQYLPGNFRPLVGGEEIVCVGAVYRGLACGAALAEETGPGEYYLRYIFVDPKARLCGLGTYLLRGLLGQLAESGAREIKALYSPSMLESGRQTLGILERAGFSAPKPVSTAFSVRLGDICCPELKLPEGMGVYPVAELPDALIDAYEELVLSGSLPYFVDPESAKFPSAEMSCICAVHGEIAGVILIDRQEDTLFVSGLYVQESYRKGYAAVALISRCVREARRLCPPETEVFTSAINRESFAICDKLFRRNSTTHKETELLSVYQF